MRANQLRLWFAAVAYVLVNHLRHTSLRDTELARAQVSTTRCRLLKLGARLTVSVLANLRRTYPLRI
jgi:Transposase DDE domain group 1